MWHLNGLWTDLSCFTQPDLAETGNSELTGRLCVCGSVLLYRMAYLKSRSGVVDDDEGRV